MRNECMKLEDGWNSIWFVCPWLKLLLFCNTVQSIIKYPRSEKLLINENGNLEWITSANLDGQWIDRSILYSSSIIVFRFKLGTGITFCARPGINQLCPFFQADRFRWFNSSHGI